MRRYKVIWTEAAVRDLEDLARYIARDSPANARRVMKRLHGRAESLQDLPERGRLVPELLDLGLRVAFERFKEAWSRESGESGEGEPLRHLNEAAGFYRQALELLPPDAVGELAVTHNQLGGIYGSAGDIDRALPHFRDAIRYEEQQGNVYGASRTRFNVALALLQSGRPGDALEYARAALRGYESYGESAAEMIQRTRQLIGRIEGQV